MTSPHPTATPTPTLTLALNPGKKLSINQWLAVAILAVGIVCVQGILDPPPSTPPSLSSTALPPLSSTAVPPPLHRDKDMGHGKGKHTHRGAGHKRRRSLADGGRLLLEESGAQTLALSHPYTP